MNNKLFGLGLLLNILLVLVSSWALIHILAIFGVFLAVAYPLWWLFAPQQTVCFLCRAKKDGDHCSFCSRSIDKKQSISPPHFVSAIFNGLLLLFFSVISIGMVLAEGKILFKLGFPPTAKTASFVIPSKSQYRLKEIFPMEISINNIKNPINAVQADISFPPDKLEIIDITTKNSFANIFIQREINNETGYARLTGGLPSPGFSSDRGTFGTVFFRSKNPGLAKIEFLPTSMVLADDGRATNILKELPTISYLILPEAITPEEEEAQQYLIPSSQVLGENTDNPQLVFYQTGSVLGTHTESEIKREQKFSLLRVVSQSIEAIDRLILSFWGRFI